MVKARSQDGDSKGKELDIEDPMESRLSRLEDMLAERSKMMKQLADMVEAFSRSTAGKIESPKSIAKMASQLQLQEELQSSNVLLEEKSKPEAQEENPKLENHEGWEQMVTLEVDGDVEKGQEVQSMEKICTAHQVFVKMPSKEKHIKHLKGWKFKFKKRSLVGIMLPIEQYKLRKRRCRMYNKLSTNIKDDSMKVMISGNYQRMVRQLHKSRVQCKMRMMNDSWSMRRLTLKIMKSHRKHKWKFKHLHIASNFWINHPHKLADLVLRTSLTEQDMSLVRVDWRTKNSTPFVMQSEMVPMQDNETVTKTYLGQAHELQDTTGSITKRLSPPVICYQNFRRRFCSLTWYSSASLEEWKHKLDMDLCGYKIQILHLSNHDLEMRMLPCLQRFSVVRMGIHVVFCLQELKPIWWVGYNEDVGVTSTKQELSHWSVANHVKRDAQESFGSKGLAYAGCVILETNFVGFGRGKTELLTSEFEDRFKSWSRSIVKLLFQNSLVHHQQTVNADDERHIMVCADKSDGQWFWMVFVSKPADQKPATSSNQEPAIFRPDNTHGMITRGKDGFVKPNLRYILLANQRIWENETHVVDITDAYSVLHDVFEMVKELLLKTSLVNPQVMRNTKLKFSKRWMFKYKCVKESIQGLQILLRYKSWLELEEWFKIWSRGKSWRKQKEIQQFTIETEVEMEDMTEEDLKQQQGDSEPLVTAPDFDAKVELVWKSNSLILHFETRVWDPGRSLIKDATPREFPFHSTAMISFSLLFFLSRITCKFSSLQTLRTRFLQGREI